MMTAVLDYIANDLGVFGEQKLCRVLLDTYLWRKITGRVMLTLYGILQTGLNTEHSISA